MHIGVEPSRTFYFRFFCAVVVFYLSINVEALQAQFTQGCRTLCRCSLCPKGGGDPVLAKSLAAVLAWIDVLVCRISEVTGSPRSVNGSDGRGADTGGQRAHWGFTFQRCLSLNLELAMSVSEGKGRVIFCV